MKSEEEDKGKESEMRRRGKGLHIEKRIEFREEGEKRTERGKESRAASYYYH